MRILSDSHITRQEFNCVLQSISSLDLKLIGMTNQISALRKAFITLALVSTAGLIGFIIYNFLN